VSFQPKSALAREKWLHFDHFWSKMVKSRLKDAKRLRAFLLQWLSLDRLVESANFLPFKGKKLRFY